MNQRTTDHEATDQTFVSQEAGLSHRWLRPGERSEDLQRDGLVIIQNPELYRFSMDPVLLSAFARVKHRDRVLDLGTGSGVLALLIWAKWRPTSIVGVEVQPELADMARRSIALNGLEDHISVIEGDLRSLTADELGGLVDVIVSNPPYDPVGSGRAARSHVEAAARQELLCTLEDVLSAASRLLKPRGSLVMVHRASRLVDIFAEMRLRQLEPKRLRFVHTTATRSPKIILVEAVKDAGRGLQVLPPLVLHGEDGLPTGELLSIYGNPRPDADPEPDADPKLCGGPQPDGAF